MRTLLLNIFGPPGNSGKDSFNKNISAFFICLLISALCWFLIVLSKTYDEKASFKVEYANLPKDKVLINRLPDSIQIDITTSGFSMLKEKISGGARTLWVDCSRLRLGRDSLSYISTSGIAGQLASQLGSDYSVQRVYPDSIFFNFGARSSKTVPVKLNISLGFAKQYQLSDSIRVEPSKVTIYGAREMIDHIDYAYTDYLVLDKLDHTMEVKLGFAESDRGLGFSSDSVHVTIPVDQFTEGNLEVPVEAVNLPPGYSLKLFPEKVNVRYMVGISSLGIVNPSMFRVEVNYSKASESSGNKLKAELVHAPSFVNSVKIDPDKIEYIIRRR